jgi:methylenetetrahydrofolate reductase (NADPH)
MSRTSSRATGSPPDATRGPGDETRTIVGLAREASVEMTWHDSPQLAACRGLLAPGTLMYVSHIPGQSWQHAVATCVAVSAVGLEPVPHIPVRELADEVALQRLIAALSGDAAVRRLLLIAGDRAEPLGPFAQTLDVLASDVLWRHAIRHVTVAGHPEGHPLIADADLKRAEREKIACAAERGIELTFLTQFFFEAGPFFDWLRKLRAQGVRARIVAGLTGPARLATLFKYALRCGVGPSIRALGARPGSFAALVGERGPESVVRAIGRATGDGAIEPVGIHLYSFGGLTRSCAWIDAVARGRFALDDSAGFILEDKR